MFNTTSDSRRSRSLTRLGRLAMVALLAGSLGFTACNGTDGEDPNGPGQSEEENQNGEVQTEEKDGYTVLRSNIDRQDDPAVDMDQVTDLTENNADFAFALYDELAKEKEGENLFYSPHSISTALAMTYAGAEGNTATEMASALHFEQDEDTLHPAFNKLDLELESRATPPENAESEGGDPFRLNIANSIWGQKNFSFQTDFLDLMARHYGAGLRTLKFAEQPDASRKVINKWVEEQTENKIKDLLKKGTITDLTRMVLTNAIYFKASWKHKFDEEATRQAEFTTLGGSKVDVDMMKLQEQNGLRYASGQNWQAVEMPYVGGEVSMVVLVPDAGKFSDVESKLSGKWVNTVFGELSGQAVKLDFPKFEYESSFSVKDMLKALGMKQAFEAGVADLSGITEATDLFIQDVVHKAFVAVDEEGTEAAAATAVVAGTTSVPTFKEVSVDRPFLFMIRDRKTGAIIFTGRVVDPS